MRPRVAASAMESAGKRLGRRGEARVLKSNERARENATREMLSAIFADPHSHRCPESPHCSSIDDLLRREWQALFRGEPEFLVEEIAVSGGLVAALGGRALADAIVRVDLGLAGGGRRQFRVVPDDPLWYSRLRAAIAECHGAKESDYARFRLLAPDAEGNYAPLAEDAQSLQRLLECGEYSLRCDQRGESRSAAGVLPPVPEFIPPLVLRQEEEERREDAAAAMEIVQPAAADLAAEREAEQARQVGKAVRDLRERIVQRVAASLGDARGDYNRTKERVFDALHDHEAYPGAAPREFWKAHGVRDAPGEVTMLAGSLASYVCRVSGAIGGSAAADALRAAPAWKKLEASLVERKASVRSTERQPCPAAVPSVDASGRKFTKANHPEPKGIHRHHHQRPAHAVRFKTHSGATVSFEVSRASAPLDASDYGVVDPLAGSLLRGAAAVDPIGCHRCFDDHREEDGYSSDETPTRDSLACMSKRVHMIQRALDTREPIEIRAPSRKSAPQPPVAKPAPAKAPETAVAKVPETVPAAASLLLPEKECPNKCTHPPAAAPLPPATPAAADAGDDEMDDGDVSSEDEGDDGPVVSRVRACNCGSAPIVVAVGAEVRDVKPGCASEYLSVRAKSLVSVTGERARPASAFSGAKVTLFADGKGRSFATSEDGIGRVPEHGKAGTRIVNAGSEAVRVSVLRSTSKVQAAREDSLAPGAAGAWHSLAPGDYLVRTFSAASKDDAAPLHEGKATLRHRAHQTLVVGGPGGIPTVMDERHEMAKVQEASIALSSPEVRALVSGGKGGLLVAPSNEALDGGKTKPGPIEHYFADGRASEMLKQVNAAGCIDLKSNGGVNFAILPHMDGAVGADGKIVKVRSVFVHPENSKVVVTVVDGLAKDFPRVDG